jgi:hypothetical protein
MDVINEEEKHILECFRRARNDDQPQRMKQMKGNLQPQQKNNSFGMPQQIYAQQYQHYPE